MKICVIGTGYVGLTTGVFLASLGNKVCCIDLDSVKVNELLDGRVPIYEPGLEEMMRDQMLADRLLFTSNLDQAIEDCEFCFIATGTPLGRDGCVDISQVLASAYEIGRRLTGSAIVVIKSTIPPGTTERVKGIIQEEMIIRGLQDLPVYIVFNPEFLREGEALRDIANPDRIILGAENQKAVNSMRVLYKPYINKGVPVLVMDSVSAEMSKYASNAMLACRISLMNELAGLCDIVGADIAAVKSGMALDHRIGNHYLNAGIGFGGSCLTKDIAAIIKLGEENNMPMSIIRAIEQVNGNQIERYVNLVIKRFGEDLSGISLGVWGLSFKPGTGDLRKAPSLDIIQSLLLRGAHIDAFDPKAMIELEASKIQSKQFNMVSSMQDAIRKKDALLLLTEWNCFYNPDWTEAARIMKQRIIFDGRNLYELESIRRYGFEYYCLGRCCLPQKV